MVVSSEGISTVTTALHIVGRPWKTHLNVKNWCFLWINRSFWCGSLASFKSFSMASWARRQSLSILKRFWKTANCVACLQLCSLRSWSWRVYTSKSCNVSKQRPEPSICFLRKRIAQRTANFTRNREKSKLISEELEANAARVPKHHNRRRSSKISSNSN